MLLWLSLTAGAVELSPLAGKVARLSTLLPAPIAAEFRARAASIAESTATEGKSLESRRCSPPLPHAPAVLEPVLDGLAFDAALAAVRNETSASAQAAGFLSLMQRGNATVDQKRLAATESASRIDAMPAGWERFFAAKRFFTAAEAEADDFPLKEAASSLAATFPALAAARVCAAVDELRGVAAVLRSEGIAVYGENALLAAANALLDLEEAATGIHDFTLRGLDGRKHSLSAERGRVVVLTFWATWCLPCREELTALDRIQRGGKDRGVTVFAVSDEPAELLRRYVEKHGLGLTVLRDPDRRVHNRYEAVSLPDTLVFAQDGRVIRRFRGDAAARLAGLVQAARSTTDAASGGPPASQ